MKALLWLDLEMSGLDPEEEKILEVAAVITDMDLKPIEEYHRVVYQPQEILDGMDEWCKDTHGKSGLTKLVPKGMPLEEVEKEVCALVHKHWKINDRHKDSRPILAGNSISSDRKFIDRYMKKFSKLLHYRLLDVSSFKTVFKAMFGVEYKKKNAHRAVDDIHESIAELKAYLKHVKVPKK
jgi:oligoribonuclease